MPRVVSLLCALTCLPALAAGDEPSGTRVRIATFNIAMGMEAPGELSAALAGGADGRLLRVAEILQRARPDIVLLNEFDYDPAVDPAVLLNDNYLSRSQGGLLTAGSTSTATA